MDVKTSPPSNFRFRDHGVDMDNGESLVGDTSTELSSITTDEDSDIESDELASMTAKGINHLCLELIELKQASEADFQDNIISNYLSFIRVFKETEGINNEVLQLKYHLTAQKKLVRDLTDSDSLKTIVGGDPADLVLDENERNDENPSDLFKVCANEVLETLDNLLFEQRLEEALQVFETEDGDSPKARFREDIPSDVWMCFKSDMAERRVLLADKLTFVADSTRVSAAELQESLTGLSRLGFDHLATRLLFKYYHTRITLGVRNLQSAESFPPGIYVHDLAKFVFSMISQAGKGFVMLYGDSSRYDSELMKWASEETEDFVACFNRHVRSISQIGGGLATVVDCVHFAMSYCLILERQNLVLRPCLVEHIRPSLEGILKARFNHFKNVISIFTSSDVWVMERYFVSGMLTETGTEMGFEHDSDYCLLTNSGRKFVSLLQVVIEDVSSLVSVFGNPILEELMDLFTEYTFILKTALTNETNDVVEGATRVKSAESLSQKVSVIANLSTLESLFSTMIRNLFKDLYQLQSVIDGRIEALADTCSRLKTYVCTQYVQSVMSNEAACIRNNIDDNLSLDLMPTRSYQILFLELKKVEELAEDSITEFDWLVSLLTELIETTFDWIAKNNENWMPRENDDATDQKTDRLTQFAVDMQFLVEIARRGGYLTINMINASTDLVSRMESAIVSVGFDLNRYVVDYEKVENAAMEAIKELDKLEEQIWHSEDDIDRFDDASEENRPHSTSNSIEDDDDTHSSFEASFETTEISDDKYASTKTHTRDLTEDDINEVEDERSIDDDDDDDKDKTRMNELV